MIKLINAATGTEMWVANERVAEYLAAGHTPAVEVPPAPPLENPVAKKKPAAKKPAAKKTTKK